MAKTVVMSVRVSPEAKNLIARHVEGAHGHGVLVDKAIKTYLQGKQ